MNYCCAKGNCSCCIATRKHIRRRASEREAREKMRVLLGNAAHPPEKQNAVVTVVVRSF